MKRRQFVKLGVAGGTVYSLGGINLIGCSKNILEPTTSPSRLEFCSPVDLPEDQGGFYVEYISGKSYRPVGLNLNTWKLRCSEVFNDDLGTQVEPGFTDIMQIIDGIKNANPEAEKTFFNTFQCIGNQAGGNLISNGYFTGIPLRLFLEELGLDLASPNVRRIYFICFDGYYTNHKIERVLNDDPSPIYLVYKFNGTPLSDRRDGCLKHGHPIRLVVQEMLGMKSPKGLTDIVITDRDEVDGWWETRPISSAYPNIHWADTPPLRINSKIYEPVDFQKINAGTSLLVQGVAVGGINPVQKMEIGISRFANRQDSEIEWGEASLGPRPMEMDLPEFDNSDGTDFLEARNRLAAGPWPAPFVWTLWSRQITIPSSPGQYRLHARATDTGGNQQPFTETPEETADGTNAIHSILLQVT